MSWTFHHFQDFCDKEEETNQTLNNSLTWELKRMILNISETFSHVTNFILRT